jgi:hypothetical protein
MAPLGGKESAAALLVNYGPLRLPMIAVHSAPLRCIHTSPEGGSTCTA